MGKRNKESGNDGAFEAAEEELRGCLPPSDFQELESVLAEECAACYPTTPEEGPVTLNSKLLYE